MACGRRRVFVGWASAVLALATAALAAVSARGGILLGRETVPVFGALAQAWYGRLMVVLDRDAAAGLEMGWVAGPHATWDWRMPELEADFVEEVVRTRRGRTLNLDGLVLVGWADGLVVLSLPLWAAPVVLGVASGLALRSGWKAGRSAAGCGRCGYSLRGLPAAAVCPECGSALG